ncbi:hypothetical protein ANCDUO_13274 [Ancylostoma duodenale]|uniref:Uncharacterized protein n=1 Tax=Ancylostoma duodenale TaxID=51022 RepID=A0A0C2GCE8_9BILA|nr:hypothetical protein ANCDUO_13274 [Ancylostoma duodenale]
MCITTQNYLGIIEVKLRSQPPVIISCLETGHDDYLCEDFAVAQDVIQFMPVNSIRKYAFKQMDRAGAVLTTSECVLLGLLQDASHPKFKEVQKLILEPAPDVGLVAKL